MGAESGRTSGAARAPRGEAWSLRKSGGVFAVGSQVEMILAAAARVALQSLEIATLKSLLWKLA